MMSKYFEYTDLQSLTNWWTVPIFISERLSFEMFFLLHEVYIIFKSFNSIFM